MLPKRFTEVLGYVCLNKGTPMIQGTLTHQIVLRDKTHLACSKDEYRPAMLGLYIKDRFCFATDSFILSVGRIEEAFAEKPSFEGIIPIDIVNQFWKSKSAFKRINIYAEGFCSCDDLVKPLIEETFPPVIDLLYRELTLYKTNQDDYFTLRLNTEYLSRLASANGKPKGEINLTLSTNRKASILFCDSSISNDSNFGIFMLCKEDNLDLNTDFWIKEIKLLATPDDVIKWNQSLDKERTEALEKQSQAEDTAVSRLDFLKDYLSDNYPDDFDNIMSAMDEYFYAREVTEDIETA